MRRASTMICTCGGSSSDPSSNGKEHGPGVPLVHAFLACAGDSKGDRACDSDHDGHRSRARHRLRQSDNLRESRWCRRSEKLPERSITHAFQKRVSLSLSEIVERATVVWPRVLNLCYDRRVKRIMYRHSYCWRRRLIGEWSVHARLGRGRRSRAAVSVSDAQLIPPTANCLRTPT